MRTAVPLCLAASLLCTSACFRDLSGSITVTWELVAPDGTPVGCLPGEEVDVVALGYRFIYPCNAGAATTGPVPLGTYNASIELYPIDGLPAIVFIPVSVFHNTNTDAGHVVFTDTPAAAPTGSATFTWALHQYSLDAPPEGCQPGETIDFEVTGLQPFTTDCAAFDSQPITHLAPGTYNAYAALLFNGALEDDPRPGFGATELSVDFDVAAGVNTPVTFDFVVQAAPFRDERRTNVGLSAPKISAARPIK